MRAVFITAHGGPEVLQLREAPDPTPGPGQLCVKVDAFALNRADLLQRRGLYPAPEGTRQDIPGLEYAGVVESLGPGVTERAPGDRVMGLVPGAACAERVVVHARETISVPDHLSLTDAAAIPEAFITAWDAIRLQAGLASGDDLLIHAVASGVGTAALQLARLLGARTLGTSRSPEKLARAADLGLDLGIDASSGDFLAAVREATAGRGVDVVLDMIGGPYLDQNLKALAPGGTLITIGLMGGAAAPLNFGLLLTRRLRVVGTTLRARPLEEKIALARLFERRLYPAFTQGGPLAPVVGALMPADQIVEAHRLMESGDTFGKIVLRWT